ncbi:MAG TPA: helix-turn-helix domain-containing protein [Candidatus Acidoferrum sp.]|nr:helix-turn-helix domain-containing protein [Candidatus Acidoferrum sp.]
MREDLIDLLTKFGLQKEEAEVYVQLLRSGRKSITELSQSLNLDVKTVSGAIKRLAKQGLISLISTEPETFLANYPLKIINSIITLENSKLDKLTDSKDKLLELWDIERSKAQGIPPEFCPVQEGFKIFDEKREVIDRRLETFTRTGSCLWILSTPFWISRWAGILSEYFMGEDGTCKIPDLRILLPITSGNLEVVKSLSNCFNVKHSSVSNNVTILISDGNEAMYTGVKNDVPEFENVEITASLWSNNKEFIEIQRSIFKTLWAKGIDARFRIREIETGEPAEVTQIITNYQDIIKDFTSLINTAEREIFLWLRSDALPIFAPLIPKDAKERGISVIVMAEVNENNLDIAYEISKIADVRHIPQLIHSTGMIIDQAALQVLLYSTSETGAVLYNSIYSTSKSFIDTQYSMMEDMWNSGTELHYRAQEIKTGRVVQTFNVLKKREDVYRAFYDMIDRSKNEYNAIQTRVGVKRLYNLIKERDMPKIVYRLLAPIEEINIAEARKLTRYFEIRHLESETGAAVFISDDKELLGTSYIYDTENVDEVVYKSAFKTDISEFISIEKELFNNLWYNATPLSIREQELPLRVEKIIDVDKPKRRIIKG